MKIIRRPRSSGGAVVDAASLASTINTATEDTTPLDADLLPMTEAAASGALRRLTFANLWTWVLGRINALSTIAGAKTFSGQVELSGQSATNATSALTRALGDTRYGEMIVSFRSNDAAPIQSQTTLQSTGCSVALPVGVWEIHAQTHVTNVNTAAQFRFQTTVTGGTSIATYGKVMWGLGNTGVPNHDNDTWLTGLRTLGNGSRAWASYEGAVQVTAGTTTITTQYAQNVSTAADTIVRANTFIVARRIG